jgi:hypothetical protein
VSPDFPHDGAKKGEIARGAAPPCRIQTTRAGSSITVSSTSMLSQAIKKREKKTDRVDRGRVMTSGMSREVYSNGGDGEPN